MCNSTVCIEVVICLFKGTLPQHLGKSLTNFWKICFAKMNEWMDCDENCLFSPQPWNQLKLAKLAKLAKGSFWSKPHQHHPWASMFQDTLHGNRDAVFPSIQLSFAMSPVQPDGNIPQLTSQTHCQRGRRRTLHHNSVHLERIVMQFLACELNAL